MNRHGKLRRQLYFFHVNDVRTGNAATGLRGLLRGELYFLYVDDIRTSQETHQWPPRPIMGIALHFVIRYNGGLWQR
jgi:hypothetical protein